MFTVIQIENMKSRPVISAAICQKKTLQISDQKFEVCDTVLHSPKLLSLFLYVCTYILFDLSQSTCDSTNVRMTRAEEEEEKTETYKSDNQVMRAREGGREGGRERASERESETTIIQQEVTGENCTSQTCTSSSDAASAAIFSASRVSRSEALSFCTASRGSNTGWFSRSTYLAWRAACNGEGRYGQRGKQESRRGQKDMSDFVDFDHQGQQTSTQTMHSSGTHTCEATNGNSNNDARKSSSGHPQTLYAFRAILRT